MSTEKPVESRTEAVFCSTCTLNCLASTKALAAVGKDAITSAAWPATDLRSMKNGSTIAASRGCSRSLITVARPASARPWRTDLSERKRPIANSAQGEAAAPKRSIHFSTGVGKGNARPDQAMPAAIDTGSGLRTTFQAALRKVRTGPCPAATSSSISMTPNTIDMTEVTITASIAGGRPGSPNAARQSGTPM